MTQGLRIGTFWISSLIAGLVLLSALFPKMDARAFEDAALGDQTQTVIGYLDDDQVHCFTMVDSEACLAPAEARALEKTVLWLGNSQLHSINQFRDGDELSSVQIARAMRGQGIEMLTFSQPNANLQEHLVLFETLVDRLDPAVLLLPAVFDDTREGNIRSDVLKSVREPATSDRLLQSAIGRDILAKAEETLAGDGEPATLQDRAEAAITNFLEQASGWEDLRSRARGTVALTLYRTRNFVFGITPSSVRRKVPGTYAANLAALEQILLSASQRNVAVLLYIPPLRTDVKRPYDPKEYADFKSDIETLANTHGAAFANLEAIIPGALWGTKASTSVGSEPEYDFMHFQGQGHDLLAKNLLKRLRFLLDDL